jgi:hypothetical protein
VRFFFHFFFGKFHKDSFCILHFGRIYYFQLRYHIHAFILQKETETEFTHPKFSQESQDMMLAFEIKIQKKITQL